MIKIKFLITKKLILYPVFFLLFLGLVSAIDAISNDKISNFFSLSILYIINERTVEFNGLIINVPYFYTRQKSKSILTLIRFPHNNEIIIINTNSYLTEDDFRGRFKDSLVDLEFDSMEEEDLLIDNENGFLIIVCKDKSYKSCREYLTIPGKKITVTFYGEKNNINNFRTLINSIKFGT